MTANVVSSMVKRRGGHVDRRAGLVRAGAAIAGHAVDQLTLKSCATAARAAGSTSVVAP